MSEPTTLGELLRERAASATLQIGYRFSKDGGAISESLTYAHLDRDARGIAVKLQDAGLRPGERVLLLYAPGLEFVRALFGCIYAGAVAVPAYPPNPARMARTLPRLRMVAADCGARFVLTSSDIRVAAEAMFSLAPELASRTWLATDDGVSDPAAWRQPVARSTDLAMLQYTSGSTREPRGVMLTHDNLMHNQVLIDTAFRHSEREIYITWLPVYHDMGLIGTLMQPLYLGATCVMMPPMRFLQSPVTWLSAISLHRGTVSGAPNFAYDLCVRKVPESALAELDLSCWRVAFCGAEPVRKATLDRFARRFAPAGFAAKAFLPCYGLAEASLIVSGASRDTGAVSFSADDAALRSGSAVPASSDGARPIVGCGPAVGDQEVAIVAEGSRCAAGRIGEVWVRGRSVAAGYWERAEESKETFGARCSDGSGPFLRTGDLGFLDEEGELYIVGRTKDVIIVRGLNHFPSDVEDTVESAWPSLRPGCTVAFMLDGSDGEEVAVVCEYDARSARAGVDWDAVVNSIRSAVGEAHELSLRTVAVLAPGQVPKTTSGKVQRSATRTAYLAGELSVLHQWVARSNLPDEPEYAALSTKEQIVAFIVSWLSERLERPIEAATNFVSVGLDSIDVVALMDTLGRRVGRELAPMLAIDYPSAEELAAHLTGE